MIGAIAEDEVLQVARRYSREGRALVFKRYEPYRRMGGSGRGKEFKAVPLHRSGPDFELFLPDGRSGMIEVKAGQRASLEETQAQVLATLSTWGYIACILYRSTLTGWYLIHYSAFSPAKTRNENFLSSHGAPLGPTPDFLEAL